VEHASAFTPTVLERWRRRENLLPGLALLALAGAAWVYTAYQASIMDDTTASMAMSGTWSIALFLFSWTAMMVAMMVPATLPLILLYRTVARKRLGLSRGRVNTAILIVGYVVVWAVAGLPVYVYGLFAEEVGYLVAALPALLLVVGGAYQFTPLKRICHARCSNPLLFLVQNWRPRPTGALRLGVIHGFDCLGCCVGLMVGLVALGTMNLAWMLTTALIIFVEKTVPGSHRIAQPLGILMMVGGVVLLGVSLAGGMAPSMNSM
jgi:predicted metal-binding membrane protein